MENDPKSFVFWLQGYLELSGATTLDAQQVQMIKEHLALVLNKKTPTNYMPNIIVNAPSSFSRGPNCGVCNKICSEEGGICKKCQLGTTTSKVDAEKIYCKYIDPFENPIESPKENTSEIANVICAISC